MTCIIAIETPQGVWMGADRCTTFDGSTTTRDTPKIHRVGEMVWVVLG